MGFVFRRAVEDRMYDDEIRKKQAKFFVEAINPVLEAQKKEIQ